MTSRFDYIIYRLGDGLVKEMLNVIALLMTTLSIYSTPNHMNWVVCENFGVSHFGVHPDKLQRDHIQFKIFHLGSAVTRNRMDYLWKFILVQKQT